MISISTLHEDVPNKKEQTMKKNWKIVKHLFNHWTEICSIEIGLYVANNLKRLQSVIYLGIKSILVNFPYYVETVPFFRMINSRIYHCI